MRFPLLVVLAALLGVALSGCAPAQTTTPSAGTPADSPAPQAPAIEPMPREQVRSQIASSFPVEIPVPAGQVERGEAQGADAWDYEIVMEAPHAAVVQWYRDAYVGRSWQLVNERDVATDASAGTELTLRKGAAESRVVVLEEGGRSRAKAVVGLGPPVIESQ